MRKAEFKRMRGAKEDYVQDRLRLKRYINRAPRHKEKREDMDYED